MSIDVASKNGWKLLEAELPEDFETLAKEHKTLEVQYGPAKITRARELLRLILLHADTDWGSGRRWRSWRKVANLLEKVDF